MTERRSVGDILMGFGRLTQEEVDRALDHQKGHGGYFGEALLTLGLVSRQELDWVLASQFDIPYVTPSANEVDLSAARLVTPQWALAHNALPILRTDRSLTVVVSAPNKETRALAELEERTGLSTELALASPEDLRRLIRDVFTRVLAEEEREEGPASLSELWTEADRRGADGFGISIRGVAARGWFRADGRTHRLTLDARWEVDLRKLLSPGPEEVMGTGASGRWRAELGHHGFRIPVEVEFLRGSGGLELVIRPLDDHVDWPDSFSPPGPDLLAELGILMDSGDAGVLVTSEPAELARELLPHIPAILTGGELRSVHLTSSSEPPAGVLSIPVETFDGHDGPDGASALERFHFDVVTADLERVTLAARVVRDQARAVFVRSPDADPSTLSDAGFHWVLRVERNEWERLDWSLEPLRP